MGRSHLHGSITRKSSIYNQLSSCSSALPVNLDIFHRLPVAGKTSFAFTLAVVFGLDIYCLSLGDRTLSEDNLKTRFEYIRYRLEPRYYHKSPKL
jgi:hypothetical protein